MKLKSTHVLVILHIVGLIGLNSNYKDWFLALTPVNLLITFVIALMGTDSLKNPKTILLLVFAFIAGFSAELIGIHTGILFGDYAYGEGLGLKWREVPLSIGMNWAMLALVSRSLANRMHSNLWIQAVLASALMVVLDLWMEPVAPHLDYWYFSNGIAPFKNYAGWFSIAMIIHLLGSFLGADRWNCKYDLAIYTIQTMFFIVLILSQ